MNVQDAANLTIPEGNVRSIHDKNNQLLWSAVGYDVTYRGDTTQQTYSGKNKIPISEAIMDNDVRSVQFYTSFPAGTYTMTFVLDSFSLGTNSQFDIYSQLYTTNGYVDTNTTSGGGHIKSSTIPGQKYSCKIVLSDDVVTTQVCNIRIPQTQYNNGARASISQVQIEPGSTATPFEPYVGGIPAPNPDYPQTINVVTGTQTITLSDGTVNQDYTVGLGSIELCKIGDYQDYIFKSGDDWYLHKAVNHYILNSTTITGTVTVQGLVCGVTKPSANDKINERKGSFCSNATLKLITDTLFEGAYYENPLNFVLCGNDTDTLQTLRTKYGGGKLYYVLATPTDTKITDATLIAQLNAVYDWLRRYDYYGVVSGNLPIIINRSGII